MGQFFCGYMCRWPLKNPTPVLSVLNYTFRPHLRHFLGIQIQFSQLQLSYFLSLFKLCIRLPIFKSLLIRIFLFLPLLPTPQNPENVHTQFSFFFTCCENASPPAAHPY